MDSSLTPYIPSGRRRQKLPSVCTQRWHQKQKQQKELQPHHRRRYRRRRYHYQQLHPLALRETEPGENVRVMSRVSIIEKKREQKISCLSTDLCVGFGHEPEESRRHSTLDTLAEAIVTRKVSSSSSSQPSPSSSSFSQPSSQVTRQVCGVD